MLYARYESTGTIGWYKSDLRSQVIWEQESIFEPSNNPLSNLSLEQLEGRKSQLERAIISETNDEIKALELRRELQKVREEIEKRG